MIQNTSTSRKESIMVNLQATSNYFLNDPLTKVTKSVSDTETNGTTEMLHSQNMTTGHVVIV